MIEIERKYLVRGKPWKQYPKSKQTSMSQGYISKSPKHTVRVRVTDKKAVITIKGPTKGFSRAEYEYDIPMADGKELLDMCDGGIVIKTRHTFTDDDGQVWEIDEFGPGVNEGLIMAEIELESEDTPIILPPWIKRDVTFDKRYTNAYISNHLVPQE
jgi:adenylate cyclase